MSNASITDAAALPQTSASHNPSDAFDLDDLRPRGLAVQAQHFLFAKPQKLYGLLRRFFPVVKIKYFKLAIVTRYEDVQEILAHDDVFQVPFGARTMAINNGPNFLLGMQKSDDYWRYQRQVMQAFRREDIAAIVAPLSEKYSREIVSNCSNKLDAVQDLITCVPMQICEAYYGVAIPDKIQFAHWSIAISAHLFGNPFDNPHLERAALAAGALMRPMIDRAIESEKRSEAASNTVLGRLVSMQKNGAEGLTDEVIRAFLIGMISGFVPTNTMAAGHMLEVLLNRPKFMEPTREAALAGDDALLKRCLFEAMRFMPLNPGPFRECARDYTMANGTKIEAGMKVLAGTQSAMFDGRRIHHPRRFDPNRPSTDYMLFGHGLHWCIGAPIAEAQITQMFKVLLTRTGLRRAGGKEGTLELIGPFPGHLTVEFGD